ncbi:MAG TPA: hypothetical protein VFZ89_09425 [Solirubrobacteraceae bacterium]
MAQIGLPFRIAGAVALVFALAYFTVLKPKDESMAPPPAAPGATGLNTAVDKAHGAAATSDAANAAVQAATGGTTTPSAQAAPAAGAAAPAAGTPAAPKVSAATANVQKAIADLAPGDPSAKILRQLAAGKTAVLLFSSANAVEDAHVRSVLKTIDRHRGKIAVHRIAIGDVAEYDAITRGVQVTQAPTVLVIGTDLKARRIVGYTDRTELNQLINDVSGLRVRLKPSSYKRLVEQGCGTMHYNIRGDRQSLANLDTYALAIGDDLRALADRLHTATVPGRYTSFNKHYVRSLNEVAGRLSKIAAHPSRGGFRAVQLRTRELNKRLTATARPVGLECAA